LLSRIKWGAEVEERLQDRALAIKQDQCRVGYLIATTVHCADVNMEQSPVRFGAVLKAMSCYLLEQAQLGVEAAERIPYVVGNVGLITGKNSPDHGECDLDFSPFHDASSNRLVERIHGTLNLGRMEHDKAS